MVDHEPRLVHACAYHRHAQQRNGQSVGMRTFPHVANANNRSSSNGMAAALAPFPDGGGANATAPSIIRELAARNRHRKRSQVRQRRQEPQGCNVVVQNVFQKLRQARKQVVEPPAARIKGGSRTRLFGLLPPQQQKQRHHQIRG